MPITLRGPMRATTVMAASATTIPTPIRIFFRIGAPYYVFTWPSSPTRSRAALAAGSARADAPAMLGREGRLHSIRSVLPVLGALAGLISGCGSVVVAESQSGGAGSTGSGGGG